MISSKYDQRADALYLKLASSRIARTVEVDSGTLADIDSTGQLVGVEVIRPARDWPLDAILARFDVSGEHAQELRAEHRKAARRGDNQPSGTRGSGVNKPTPPPEAELVRLSRKARGFTIPGAAVRAGVSASLWSQIERGYRKHRGEYEPVIANDEDLADMSAAIAVDPDSLAQAGREGAARVLRELLGIQSAGHEEIPRPVRLLADRYALEPGDLWNLIRHMWEDANFSEDQRVRLIDAFAAGYARGRGYPENVIELHRRRA